jgi:3-deoxy-D-manno-octulosonate 8-phosphate phosphatase (KDO 8-P phosphatase)
MPLLLVKLVGHSGCPADAPVYVQALTKKVGKKKGGEGAFREFVEDLLLDAGVLDNVVNHWSNK